VVLGCSWTLLTALSISYLALPASATLSDATPFLGLGVVVSALFWFACGAANGTCLRPVANLLHVGVPVIWIAWAASLQGVSLSWNQGLMVASCLAMGAALADLGAFASSPLRETHPGQEKRPAPVRSPWSAYDSGRFPAPVLSAADSGGFRMPS
jgi:hypothetical protein